MEAIACVDCARWDLVGKALGQSVCALLGGYRTSLPVISIGGSYVEGKTLADIGREMEAYRKAGMAGCKFQVGGLAPEEDARRVEAARRAAGLDFVLMVDANRGWSVAVRFARLIELLDIRWFEEPCHWQDDAAMMARVRQATRIPVTAGQSEITSHGVRRLVEAGAVDLVNVDASECGGVTEWRRAASLLRRGRRRLLGLAEQPAGDAMARVMAARPSKCPGLTSCRSRMMNLRASASSTAPGPLPQREMAGRIRRGRRRGRRRR